MYLSKFKYLTNPTVEKTFIRLWLPNKLMEQNDTIYTARLDTATDTVQ